MVIGFSEDNSYVYYKRKWIETNTLSILSTEPQELKMIFNKDKFSKDSRGNTVGEIEEGRREKHE